MFFKALTKELTTMFVNNILFRSWKSCRNAFYHLCHKIKAGNSIQLSKEQLALLYSLRLERLRPTPVSTSTMQPRVEENLEGLRIRYPGIRISFTPAGECIQFSLQGRW